MEPRDELPFGADASFDGGALDCGNGLLLLIRRHIDPLDRGQLLEILSSESSVEQDLPAWCRLTGNELVGWTRTGAQRRYLVCKGAMSERGAKAAPRARVAVRVSEAAPATARRVQAPPLPPLAVTGIGSWPRPGWMLRAIHEHLQGRLAEDEFQATADDAVRLAVQAQLRAGVDLVTDGEQRRDSYASFVGGRLDNCQLVPLTDLLPLVEDPEKFELEMRSLDVPASEVRHPAVLGRVSRSRPLAGHELEFVRTLTDRPVKVALPGPYLLTRTMWMECISDRAYANRDALAEDIVRVLREEVIDLLARGAALVQLDEPVLTEVVFRRSGGGGRSFMCGALSEGGETSGELSFARDLINAVVDGIPRERVALHTCRGNWTRDESAALAGDYRPLLGVLGGVRVGTLLLEGCTTRAGEIEVLAGLPEELRIGVGLVDQKRERVETEEEVLACARRAVSLFGAGRVLLHPDCGFATFADNPIASAAVAEAKLAVLARAAAVLRRETGLRS